MQQPPGHGAHLVEEVEHLCCPFRIDGTGPGEEAEMSVDLFRRGERDAPVVDPVAARPPMALAEVRRYRRGTPDHLVGKALQGGGYPPDEGDGGGGRLEGGAVDGEVGSSDQRTGTAISEQGQQTANSGRGQWSGTATAISVCTRVRRCRPPQRP